MKNFVIINTKGGVGKTTIGLNVLPVLFNGDEININYFQLDNNNKISVTSDYINIEEFRLNKLTEALAKIEFSDNDINIIDAGGGDDAKAVISELANSILDNLIFIIPVSKNLSIQHNISETVNMINELIPNSKAYLFLNYFNGSTSEYINLFGSDLYNIPPLIDTLPKVDKKVFGIIADTNLFQIIELRNEILLDKYKKIKHYAEQKEKILKQKKTALYNKISNGEITTAEGEKEYIQYNKQIKQAEKIVNLVKALKEYNADFVSEVNCPIQNKLDNENNCENTENSSTVESENSSEEENS